MIAVSYAALSCDTGKISVNDKMSIENPKREKWDTKKFVREFQSERWFKFEDDMVKNWVPIPTIYCPHPHLHPRLSVCILL